MESLYNKTQPFIHDYFTVVDLIKMRRVCKFFRRMGLAKIFRKRLIGNISRICEVNFAEATQLLKNIDDCNCIISGSIILQTLYSEEFKGSDIDIYYNRDANAKKDEQAQHIIQHVLELKEKPLRKLVMGFHYDGISLGPCPFCAHWHNAFDNMPHNLTKCICDECQSVESDISENCICQATMNGIITRSPFGKRIIHGAPSFTLMFDYRDHEKKKENNDKPYEIDDSNSIDNSDSDDDHLFMQQKRKKEKEKNKEEKCKEKMLTKYRKLQIIEVDRCKLLSDHQLVTEHFDCSIVMNTYSSGTLEVYNTDYLFKRRNHQVRNSMLMGRIYKYYERGFPLYRHNVLQLSDPPDIYKANYDLYRHYNLVIMDLNERFCV